MTEKEINSIFSKHEKLSGEDIDSALVFYKPLVLRLSRRYFLLGGDGDDLNQEGMIGLYEALRNWNPEKKNASFEAFASLCINRRLLSAIKKAGRNKHKPLNESMSVEYLDAETQENPEDIVLSKERGEELGNEIRSKLTAYEKKVLSAFLDGLNYTQIAKILSKDTKSIDNALQRIKGKLRCLN